MRGDRIRELIGSTVREKAGPADTIVANQLAKRHPNRTEAVRGIAFRVRAGELFGLLGPPRRPPDRVFAGFSQAPSRTLAAFSHRPPRKDHPS